MHHVKEQRRHEASEMKLRVIRLVDTGSDSLIGWGMLGCLALGAALGAAVGVPCSRWMDESPLLYIALQSAFTGIMLSGLVRGQLVDLAAHCRHTPVVPEMDSISSQPAAC